MSEVERRQQYLDKMIGEAEVLRPLVEECLDDDPAVRPTIATVCERIQVSKDTYVKECPQDVITLHQQVQELRVEIEKVKNEKDDTIQQMINQMVMDVLEIVSITLYGIVFLTHHKEYTNTTSSQST